MACLWIFYNAAFIAFAYFVYLFVATLDAQLHHPFRGEIEIPSFSSFTFQYINPYIWLVPLLPLLFSFYCLKQKLTHIRYLNQLSFLCVFLSLIISCYGLFCYHNIIAYALDYGFVWPNSTIQICPTGRMIDNKLIIYKNSHSYYLSDFSCITDKPVINENDENESEKSQNDN